MQEALNEDLLESIHSSKVTWRLHREVGGASGTHLPVQAGLLVLSGLNQFGP